MSYAKKHVTEFQNHAWFYPFLVGAYKTLGGVLSAFTNILVIMQSDNATDVVQDFVAVNVLYNIDNIMACTLFDSPSKDSIEEGEKKIMVKRENEQLTDIELVKKFMPGNKSDPDRLDWIQFLMLMVAILAYRVFAFLY